MRFVVVSLVVSVAATAPLLLQAGDLVPPWDWERGARLAAAGETKSLQCRIKGNFRSTGERIYHVPGGEFYGRTRVNAAKGERWFCTEEEARSAGWRRSKR